MYKFAIFLFFSLLNFCRSCQYPDIPQFGKYSMTVSGQFLPGVDIRYSCLPSAYLVGDQIRTCQVNGRWTGQIPFCEQPSLLKSASGSEHSLYPNFAIDGNEISCFTSARGTGQFFRTYLKTPAIVNIIRILLPAGNVKLNIILGHSNKRKTCGSLHKVLDEKKWVDITCDEAAMASLILFQDISDSPTVIQIYEVQVYTRTNLWCSKPPTNIYVPNGWLSVSRSTAILYCKEGYTPGQNRGLVCDSSDNWSQTLLECKEILCELSLTNVTIGGEWRIVGNPNKLSIGTRKRLLCDDGYILIDDGPETVECLRSGVWSSTSARCEKKPTSESEGSYSGIIIITSSIVVIIITSCSILVIFLIVKKKSKPVVVVVKQNDTGSVSYNETEYCSVNYDTATTLPRSLSRYPELPKSRPPLQIENEYSTAKELLNPPPYNDEYTEPNGQQTITKPENLLLTNLKKSPLYGR